MGLGTGGLASAVLTAEVCAPILMLCWLCCWPDDSDSDKSSSASGKPPKEPIVKIHFPGHSKRWSLRRRSSDHHRSSASANRGHKLASSAVSLHLPTTSGMKQSLTAHRSHEEIHNRRKSNLDPSDDSRYHSAPSVIDEVLHRRDWDKSSKELYVPLHGDEKETMNDKKATSADQLLNTEVRPCKKHYTNIKSSKRSEKESNAIDVKDTDATENGSSFYIGEIENTIEPDNNIVKRKAIIAKESDEQRAILKAKEAKQSFNESIKSKKMIVVEENVESIAFEEQDRSGAMHHDHESRGSLVTYVSRVPLASVDPIGYDGCFLSPQSPVALRLEEDLTRAAAGMRGRHASDGDILSPARRPESGAFSESDLDVVEGAEKRPPPYTKHQQYKIIDRKETAI